MKANKKSSREPARSEIAKINWEKMTIKVETSTILGKANLNRFGLRFWVLAVGPKGRYTAFTGTPFQAKSQTDGDSYVAYSDASDAALDEVIQHLWKEGWQPTSFGRHWHEINFRRFVPEPEEAAAATPSQAPAPAQATTPSASAEAFRQVEAAYTRLRADLAAGRVNPDQYRAAFQKLKIQEPNGRQWTIDGQSGRWLLWDGSAWKQADPPRN
jgi:hypothetical protein